MKKSLWKRIAFAALAVVMFGIGFLGNYPQVVVAETTIQQDKNELNNLKNEMSSIDDRLNTLKKQLAQAEADKADLVEQVQLLGEQVAVITEKIELCKQLQEACKQRIQETNAEIEKLSKEIEEQQEIIRQRLILDQEMGDMSYLDFILGSTSLSDLLERVEVMNNLFANDKKVMEGLEANVAIVQEKKQELEATKAELEQQERDYALQEEELNGKIALAQEKIEELKTQESQLSKTQQEVQKSKNQLDADMKKLAAQIKEKEERQMQDGDFMWPVPKQYSRVSQEYKGSAHTGLDIPTNGTPVDVYAAASGKVLVAGWHWSYGNYVVIYHGTLNGKTMQTLYAHMDSLKVKVNQEVTRGQVIGKTGNTGYSFGVHLHFIIYENGSHVDPRKYFPKNK